MHSPRRRAVDNHISSFNAGLYSTPVSRDAAAHDEVTVV